MEQATYLDETQRIRDNAQRDMNAIERELEILRQNCEVLRSLIRAYDTVLQQTNAAEGIRHPSLEMPLGDVGGPTTDGQPPEVTPGEDRRIPSRRPEFQNMTLPMAVDTLVERPEFHGIMNADNFVDAIYDIAIVEQRVTARRTINAELSRAVQRGVLHRVGRGRFVPISSEPIGIGGVPIE